MIKRVCNFVCQQIVLFLFDCYILNEVNDKLIGSETNNKHSQEFKCIKHIVRVTNLCSGSSTELPGWSSTELTRASTELPGFPKELSGS